MKVAITSTDQTNISGKADECLKYWVYTIENKVVVNQEYIQLKEGQNLYNIFVDRAVEIFVHPIFEVDMLLTHDISALVTARLKEKRTVAFIIEETNIEEVLKQLIAGTLQGYIAEEQHNNCGH
ncbi:MAG: hypothetical protein N4A35_05125 [Flavobacteriales bacterium]|jgi:predicted Fe-Mo cluster-binding NifX family protein|nr:hypothetical protein [Flavobacteriales bacterium]